MSDERTRGIDGASDELTNTAASIPGMRISLDCPPYRDPGERIEISAFLESDIERQVRVSLLQRAGTSAWSVHEEKNVACFAGETVEVILDIDSAVPDVTDLALLVSVGDGEPLRVEQRVFVGEGTEEGRGLALEYRRRFPNGEIFEGTLRELGKMIAFRDLAAGINIEWRGLMLKTQYNLTDPKVRARADKVASIYHKWLPNYSKVLQGMAEALNVSVEVCMLAEQTLPEGIRETEGCIDIAFRTRNGVLLAWNKERRGSGPEGLVYSRYRIFDGLSLHTLAAYGANAAGLCAAGAALYAGPKANAKGVESVAEWRANGGLIAPGGVFLLLLECRTVDEAIRLIENPDIPFANIGNIMLVDADGGVAVWQTNGLQRVFRRPEPNWKVFTCTNYPAVEWDYDDSDAATAARTNGKQRETNLERLISGLDEEVDVEAIKRILRNHSMPGSLCQHKNNNPATNQTVMSYIIDPNTTDIHATYHYPCQHKYMRYSLETNYNDAPPALPCRTARRTG